MEHLIVQNGAEFLPFARSRAKALKASGRPYASQKFEVNGVSIQVRVTPGHEYLTLSGGREVYVYAANSYALSRSLHSFGHFNGLDEVLEFLPPDTDDPAALLDARRAARSALLALMTPAINLGVDGLAGILPPPMVSARKSAWPNPITLVSSDAGSLADGTIYTYHYEISDHLKETTRPVVGTVAITGAFDFELTTYDKFEAGGFLMSGTYRINYGTFPKNDATGSLGRYNASMPVVNLTYEIIPEYADYLRSPTEAATLDDSVVEKTERYLRSGAQVALVFFEFLAYDLHTQQDTWTPFLEALTNEPLLDYSGGSQPPEVKKVRVMRVMHQRLGADRIWSAPQITPPPEAGYEEYDYVWPYDGFNNVNSESLVGLKTCFVIFKNWTHKTLWHDGYIGPEISEALAPFHLQDPPHLDDPSLEAINAFATSGAWERWLAAKALEVSGAYKFPAPPAI